MRRKKEKKRWYKERWFRDLIIILIIIAIIILIAYYSINNLEISKILAGNKTECNSDADCILQQTTCCSCSMGGKQECMARDKAKIWQEKLENCSKDIMCIAMYNCRIKSCKCVDGKCLGVE